MLVWRPVVLRTLLVASAWGLSMAGAALAGLLGAVGVASLAWCGLGAGILAAPRLAQRWWRGEWMRRWSTMTCTAVGMAFYVVVTSSLMSVGALHAQVVVAILVVGSVCFIFFFDLPLPHAGPRPWRSLGAWGLGSAVIVFGLVAAAGSAVVYLGNINHPLRVAMAAASQFPNIVGEEWWCMPWNGDVLLARAFLFAPAATNVAMLLGAGLGMALLLVMVATAVTVRARFALVACVFVFLSAQPWLRGAAQLHWFEVALVFRMVWLATRNNASCLEITSWGLIAASVGSWLTPMSVGAALGCRIAPAKRWSACCAVLAMAGWSGWHARSSALHWGAALWPNRAAPWLWWLGAALVLALFEFWRSRRPFSLVARWAGMGLAMAVSLVLVAIRAMGAVSLVNAVAVCGIALLLCVALAWWARFPSLFRPSQQWPRYRRRDLQLPVTGLLTVGLFAIILMSRNAAGTRNWYRRQAFAFGAARMQLGLGAELVRERATNYARLFAAVPPKAHVIALVENPELLPLASFAIVVPQRRKTISRDRLQHWIAQHRDLHLVVEATRCNLPMAASPTHASWDQWLCSMESNVSDSGRLEVLPRVQVPEGMRVFRLAQVSSR